LGQTSGLGGFRQPLVVLALFGDHRLEVGRRHPQLVEIDGPRHRVAQVQPQHGSCQSQAGSQIRLVPAESEGQRLAVVSNGRAEVAGGQFAIAQPTVRATRGFSPEELERHRPYARRIAFRDGRVETHLRHGAVVGSHFVE
jgi:hypothetical protein